MKTTPNRRNDPEWVELWAEIERAIDTAVDMDQVPFLATEITMAKLHRILDGKLAGGIGGMAT